MKVNDAITGLLLIFFAIAVFYLSQGAPTIRDTAYGSAFFPRMVAALMGVCGFYMAVKEVVAHVRYGKGEALFSVPDWTQSKWLLTNFVLTIGSLVIYIMFSDVVGFDIIGTGTLFVLFVALRRGQILSSLLISVIATCTIHYVFGHFLRVPLPWGILENYAFF